jgi:uncharacterized membrane protein
MDNPFVSYRSRLERDLEHWRDKGWIDADGVAAISVELAARRSGMTFAQVVAVLGAAVLCFAGMTFVAANWDEMARWLRLVTLFGAMWGCYGVAYVLLRKELNAFGQGAVLAGCGMFGANIMLIAQTYHIEGHPPGAVLLWAAGTLLAAGLLRSGVAGALGFILLVLWSGWEMSYGSPWLAAAHERFVTHWPFLAAWLGATGLAAWQRWPHGEHMAGLAMVAWVLVGALNGASSDLFLMTGLAVAVLAVWQARSATGGFLAKLPWNTVFVYAALVATASFWALQFDARGLEQWAYAGAGLLAAVTQVAAARGMRSRIGALAGYLFFAAELIYIYFEALGSLIDTAAFFALSGATLIVIAWAAMRLERSRSQRTTQQGASS